MRREFAREQKLATMARESRTEDARRRASARQTEEEAWGEERAGVKRAVEGYERRQRSEVMFVEKELGKVEEKIRSGHVKERERESEHARVTEAETARFRSSICTTLYLSC